MNDFRRWLNILCEDTDAELNAWFKGSKIVDAAGNPLIVYHGTDDSFSKFRSQGISYLGIYFSASRAYAADYGGKVIAAYVKVTRPFVMALDDRESEHHASARYGEIVLNGRIVGFYRHLTAETITALTEAGYDGIVAHYEGTQFFEVVAFDPDQVRVIETVKEARETGGAGASKEEIRAAAADVMKRMGITPVVHWYEGADDDLDKGMHIPGTGVMYLNSRTLSSVADARGVTAHESMHHKFSKALQQYDAEKQAGRNGPAHAALWTFLEGPDRDKLRKAGGVSSYSQKAWRQAALRPDLLGAERSAHHETLAEIARLKEAPESVQGTMKVKPIWQRYFAAVNRLYRS